MINPRMIECSKMDKWMQKVKYSQKKHKIITFLQMLQKTDKNHPDNNLMHKIPINLSNNSLIWAFHKTLMKHKTLDNMKSKIQKINEENSIL